MLSEEEFERYQRQILVIGDEHQNRLKKSTVLQIGVGGLGSPLALYLAAAGVGTLILVDHDILSLSNLGRQVLYTSSQINQKKIDEAAERLQDLNPNIKIVTFEGFFDVNLGKKIMEEYTIDYIVDASDNFKTKYAVNDFALEMRIPATIAGIQGLEGQIISIIPSKTSCYRCIFGNRIPEPQISPIPVMNFTCGVVGSIEAAEVIKGLLNMEGRILDGIVIVNLDQYSLIKIPINQKDSCRCNEK